MNLDGYILTQVETNAFPYRSGYGINSGSTFIPGGYTPYGGTIGVRYSSIVNRRGSRGDSNVIKTVSSAHLIATPSTAGSRTVYKIFLDKIRHRLQYWNFEGTTLLQTTYVDTPVYMYVWWVGDQVIDITNQSVQNSTYAAAAIISEGWGAIPRAVHFTQDTINLSGMTGGGPLSTLRSIRFGGTSRGTVGQNLGKILGFNRKLPPSSDTGWGFDGLHAGWNDWIGASQNDLVLYTGTQPDIEVNLFFSKYLDTNSLPGTQVKRTASGIPNTITRRPGQRKSGKISNTANRNNVPRLGGIRRGPVTNTNPGVTGGGTQSTGHPGGGSQPSSTSGNLPASPNGNTGGIGNQGGSTGTLNPPKPSSQLGACCIPSITSGVFGCAQLDILDCVNRWGGVFTAYGTTCQADTCPGSIDITVPVNPPGPGTDPTSPTDPNGTEKLPECGCGVRIPGDPLSDPCLWPDGRPYELSFSCAACTEAGALDIVDTGVTNLPRLEGIVLDTGGYNAVIAVSACNRGGVNPYRYYEGSFNITNAVRKVAPILIPSSVIVPGVINVGLAVDKAGSVVGISGPNFTALMQSLSDYYTFTVPYTYTVKIGRIILGTVSSMYKPAGFFRNCNSMSCMTAGNITIVTDGADRYKISNIQTNLDAFLAGYESVTAREVFPIPSGIASIIYTAPMKTGIPEVPYYMGGVTTTPLSQKTGSGSIFYDLEPILPAPNSSICFAVEPDGYYPDLPPIIDVMCGWQIPTTQVIYSGLIAGGSRSSLTRPRKRFTGGFEIGMGNMDLDGIGRRYTLFNAETHGFRKLAKDGGYSFITATHLGTQVGITELRYHGTGSIFYADTRVRREYITSTWGVADLSAFTGVHIEEMRLFFDTIDKININYVHEPAGRPFITPIAFITFNGSLTGSNGSDYILAWTNTSVPSWIEPISSFGIGSTEFHIVTGRSLLLPYITSSFESEI